jgi:hypothetical protein
VTWNISNAFIPVGAAVVDASSASVAEEDSRDIVAEVLCQRDCIKTANLEQTCVVMRSREPGAFEDRLFVEDERR